MASVFDGLTGVLADVFGAPVSWAAQGGAPVAVQSVFRETPVEVSTVDAGTIWITAPTWWVSRALAADVRRGDLITLSDGRVFKVLNRYPSGSAAADAFWVCEMEAQA